MTSRNTRWALSLMLCTALVLAAVIALPLTVRAEAASVSTWVGLCRALSDPLCGVLST